MDDPLIGNQLGNYQIQRLLGEGGMATVYYGWDVRLNRPAAVKVIHAPYQDDPEYLQRFNREARAIARLDHPAVVQLYHYGEASGMLYMAMQLIDGLDLAAVMKSYRDDQEFMDPDDIRRIIRQVSEALDYIHSHGIIHRDVKPANIILNKEGSAVLADFGLALLTESGTRGTILGSPHYLSPEQARSSASVVPQSDLYSVGIILYELFTGRLPYTADSPLDVAMLHLAGQAQAPHLIRTEIQPAVEQVILKAMALEPQDRYPSGQDLAGALDAALRPAELFGFEEAVSLASAPTGSPPREPLPTVLAAEYPDLEPTAPVATGPHPPQVHTPAGESTSAAHSHGEPAQPVRAAGAAFQPARTVPARTWVYAGLSLSTCLVLGMLMVGLLAGLTNLVGKKASPAGTQVVAGPVLMVTVTPGLTNHPVQNRTSTPAVFPTATSTSPATHTGTPTTTQTPTPAATQTPTAAATKTATSSMTPMPSSPPPSRTPTPVFAGALPRTYSLIMYKHGDQTFLVMNSGAEDFPLAKLRLESKWGEAVGSDLEVERLRPGECAGWSNKSKLELPSVVRCDPVGQAQVEGRKPFWQADLNVFWGNERIGTCPDKLEICSLRSR